MCIRDRSGIISSNPQLAITVVILFLVLAVLLVSLYFHFRLRATKMRLGLEKAEADSRAKTDFLSRMSHEIRTPVSYTHLDVYKRQDVDTGVYHITYKQNSDFDMLSTCLLYTSPSAERTRILTNSR